MTEAEIIHRTEHDMINPVNATIIILLFIGTIAIWTLAIIGLRSLL